MSWKQQALAEAKSHLMEIEDLSTLTEYHIVLRAPEGHTLWATEDSTIHIVMNRGKGTDKARVWKEAYNDATTGIICSRSCEHMKKLTSTK